MSKFSSSNQKFGLTLHTKRSRSLAEALHAPVFQWIEYRIPVPKIRVRFPTGVLLLINIITRIDQNFSKNKTTLQRNTERKKI